MQYDGQNPQSLLVSQSSKSDSQISHNNHDKARLEHDVSATMPDGAAAVDQYVFLKRPMLSGPNPVGECAHKYHLIERIQVITEKSDSCDSDNDSSINIDSSVSMVVEQEDGN